MHEPFGCLADVVGLILARRWRQREKPSAPTSRKSTGGSGRDSSNEAGRRETRRPSSRGESELPPK